jgi:hypothetical protein
MGVNTPDTLVSGCSMKNAKIVGAANRRKYLYISYGYKRGTTKRIINQIADCVQIKSFVVTDVSQNHEAI